jgi:insertion element IS1 protein InsB
MITHTICCRRCQSERLVRNGSVKGRAKYRCRACGYSGYFDTRQTARQQRRQQIERLLSERLSLRAIARLVGVTAPTVSSVLKKSRLPATHSPDDESSGRTR